MIALALIGGLVLIGLVVLGGYMAAEWAVDWEEEDKE